MALVVRWPHTLQLKATSILRRGDLVNKDHGKVEILQFSAVVSGIGGPSIPDPVVHPPPVAALRTIPIAASYKGLNQISYQTGISILFRSTYSFCIMFESIKEIKENQEICTDQ